MLVKGSPVQTVAFCLECKKVKMIICVLTGQSDHSRTFLADKQNTSNFFPAGLEGRGGGGGGSQERVLGDWEVSGWTRNFPSGPQAQNQYLHTYICTTRIRGPEGGGSGPADGITQKCDPVEGGSE